MERWLVLINVGTAIGVSVDASRLSAKRGALGGGLLDMGPAGWFFGCLLFWVITLPCYLAARPRLVRRAHALATHPQFASAIYPHGGPPPMQPAAGYAYVPVSPQTAPYQGYAPAPQTAPTAPPPGYYPNPKPGGYGTLWWDGARWESDSG